MTREGWIRPANLILTVLAAVAEFERQIIRERTLLGLERARRAGRRLGRPPRVKLEPDRISEMRAEGRTWKQVAATLGCTVQAARWAARKGTRDASS